MGTLKPSAPIYDPAPIDSSRVKLTGDILGLMEQLASNTHEVWARERIAQGWKYGPSRDDSKKEHPCLVPYSKLTEEEKKLDRASALETVKAILLLGYQMQAPQGHIITSEGEVSSVLREVLEQIKKNPNLTVADLRRYWENHTAGVWSRCVEVYQRFVDYALRLGESFLAFDISVEGMQTFRNDLRLTQLHALALARTGATRRANAILDNLRQSGHQDEETLGILARTHKDFWLLAPDPEEKKNHLRVSFELYLDSYRRNRGYYSGINAAAMGLLYGEKEIARQLAGEVAALCESTLEHLSPDSSERYWLDATLAEASLILGDFARAESHYKRACQGGLDKMVIISRTRSQARLLLEHITGNLNQLDFCFRLPRVVVFSGHMFDQPGRKKPRFPLSAEASVRDALVRKLAALNAQFGFCSLACGADLLFAEALLERGGEVHIFLPFKKEEFRKASVDILPGIDLGSRFEYVLSRAATVTVLNEWGNANDGAAFDYCNRAINGMALLKGQFFGMDVVPLAVWDGHEGDGRGGTQSFVNYWGDKSDHVEVIFLDKYPAQDTPETPVHTASAATAIGAHTPQIGQEIKAMLFADIVGFTKLTEVQIPPFVEHFMGKVADLVGHMKHPPIHKNTWGDAVCCVFDHIVDAGMFALDLQDMVRGTNWSQWGLPNELNIRIALHAGPVYECFDPVLAKKTFYGSHVNRTARIEPVVEEGQIYASQAFAALAAAEGIEEFFCDYVGTRQLAKNFGAIPVFLLRGRA